jgi:hypothetical protein
MNLAVSATSPVRGLLIVGTAMLVGIIGTSILLVDEEEKIASGEDSRVDPRIPAFVIGSLISTLFFFYLLFRDYF